MNARTSFPPRSVHAWIANDREDLAVARFASQRPRPQPVEQSLHTDSEAQLPAAVEKASRVLDYITYALVTVLVPLFLAFVVLLIRSLTGR